MFRIVLVHPEIPPNTGCELHLIEPLGFSMDDKLLRRAGLDYHEYAPVRRHADWQAFLQDQAPQLERMFAFTTRGSRPLNEAMLQPGDWLVFGCETAGLPDAIVAEFAADTRLRIPMRPGVRSINLSNAVAVAVYEAWRQQGCAGSE